MLFALGWGPSYFERLGRRSPVPRPEGLSATEVPALDSFAACLHLASDHQARLRAVEDALVRGTNLPGADAPTDLREALRWRETRTGFVGAGLPARHQRDTAGIPQGCPVSGSTPLFMGFKSGYRRNQATESAVTIPHGPLAGGTTMQVSRLSLGLDSWYQGLDDAQRAALMFAPQISPADVDTFTTDPPTYADQLADSARRYGLVGHAQASAGARREGKPRILRRDFNTTDGGGAGRHFVALQRSIADFVATRQAMNAAHAAQLHPAVTQQVNNGIKEWFEVVARGNYLVPPRAQRAFPLLTGTFHT